MSLPTNLYCMWDQQTTQPLAWVEMVLPWNVIETVNGYNFGPIQREIDKQAKLGRKVVLGIRTNSPGFQRRCVPSWIPCTTLHKGSRVADIPNITPDYKEGLKNLILALGKAFDGKLHAIELRDRRFGEQNDSYDHDIDLGSGQDYHLCIPTRQEIHDVIDWYFEAFPQTQKVTFTDDPEVVSYVQEKDHTVWLHRASLGNKQFTNWTPPNLKGVTVICEPYGPSASQTLAIQQIQALKKQGAILFGGCWNVSWDWGKINAAMQPSSIFLGR